jgi:hypothetical protein
MPVTRQKSQRPCAEVRRPHPTFLLTAEPPTWGEEWEKQSFREHIQGWTKLVGQGPALPSSIYIFVLLKLYAYGAVFWYYLRDPSQSMYSEQNFKRWLVYNVLGDVLGFNSTSAALGFRLKYFFVTWYNLLRPGSLTCPLLPGVRAVRSWWQSAGFVLYVSLLVRALRADAITPVEMAPIVGTLAVLTLFDFVTFQACRGEHQGYMLVCLLFPWNHALTGCQCVQLALWFFAGLAKVGPWMKYVNAFMMPNGLVLRFTNAIGLLKYRQLFANPPHDMAPSRLLAHLATFGVLTELSLSPLVFASPTLGVPLIICFHLYILSMLPFASVNEWNVSCIYFTLFFFKESTISAAHVEALDPRLKAFLALVLLAVPIFGQLCPKHVPFLTAYRPYAGNWRFTWHIVSAKAKHKLNRLKTLEGPFLGDNARTVFGDNPHFCDQIEDYLTGNMVFFPHFRPIVPIIEKLKADNGWTGHRDCLTFFQETFFNATHGWCLGTGYYARGAYFEALTSTCGFEEKECYLAAFEPQGLLDHTSEWSVVDVTRPDVKIIHGKRAYADLEKFQVIRAPPHHPIPTPPHPAVLEKFQVM